MLLLRQRKGTQEEGLLQRDEEDGFFWGGVTKKKIRALFDITIVKAPAKLANPTEQARLLMTIQKLKRL